MAEPVAFGPLLRGHRRAAGLTLEELAEAVAPRNLRGRDAPGRSERPVPRLSKRTSVENDDSRSRK